MGVKAMSEKGIKELSDVIEFIKNKEIGKALLKYQRYSKMPSKKSRKYINELEERVLKGDVGIGNIPDSELEMFNTKPSNEDILKRKGEVKRNVIIVCVAVIIFFILALSDIFETKLYCDICNREMQPNQTAYSRTARTTTAGDLSSSGAVIYCSPSCLDKYLTRGY